MEALLLQCSEVGKGPVDSSQGNDDRYKNEHMIFYTLREREKI